MKKDLTDLINFMNKKESKPEGEVVSLCEYRKDKAYLKQRAEKIKKLENLREELKVAEFHLYSFISAMDNEQPKNKTDYLVVELVRFVYDQWHMIKDMIERKVKQAKTDG